MFSRLKRLFGDKPVAPASRFTPQEIEAIRLHRAGATSRHQSPFSDRVIPKYEGEDPAALFARYVTPYYMEDVRHLTAKKAAVAVDCKAITDADLHTLLIYFDWRPRFAATRFCILTRNRTHEGLIQDLLLRSDVCYAGKQYCLYLADRGGEDARSTLIAYLDHYLTRFELRYDQSTALSALAYLDQKDGRDDAADRMAQWDLFKERALSGQGSISPGRIEQQLTLLHALLDTGGTPFEDAE